jgi:hypothetical protein
MNASRFRVEEKTERLRPRRSSQRQVKWVALEKSRSVRELAAKAAKTPKRRLFALVSRPQPSNSDTQPIRRILIFDNHPATLRLLAGAPVDSQANDSASTTRLVVSSVVALALIGLAAFAMFWPLISR